MKIMIIGGSSKSRYFPEKLGDDVEVWGLNAIYPEWIPGARWDRRFNLHTYENLKRYRWKQQFFNRETRFSAIYRNVPFYTMDEWPAEDHLRGWQPFPYRRMIESMPHGSYHCGSIDWMVAFAIWLERSAEEHKSPVKEIELHGVQLNMEAGEPISARACLEYWCGVAEGRGIKVTLAGDAHLFDFYHLVRSDLIYGVDDTPIFENATAKEITSRLEDVPYDYDE